MKILAGGLPLRLKARLSGRLKDAEVVAVSGGEEILELLAHEKFELLILSEELTAPSALEVLEKAQKLHNGRILLCAKQGHPSDYLQNLVKRLRVTAILQHPIDPDELVRRASIELDTQVPQLEARSATPTRTIPPALVAVWQRHQVTNQERCKLLIQVCIPIPPDEETLESARRAAHQLAGSLGTFGLQQGSLWAREAEELIQRFHELNEQQRTRLNRVVHALELQIADPSVRLPDLDKSSHKGSVLIYSPDNEWLEQMSQSAGEADWECLSTDDASGARSIFALENPHHVVLDLSDSLKDGLPLIHDLSGRGHQLLVVLATPTQLPGCRTLVKPVSPQQLLEALEQDEEGEAPPPRRVLAVDDDEVVLETLTAILQALNIEVHPLLDPLIFWDALETVKPELLILDVDLPYLGGVELCRAVRSDPRYRGLPVLFLSAYNDAETVQRVFLAGGDDYVYKPIAGPELLTRVRNRLERANVVEQPRPEMAGLGRGGIDLAIITEFEELSRYLYSEIGGEGGCVELLNGGNDPELLERLTVPGKQPRILLVDGAITHELLPRLDALGITAHSQVWVRGEFSAQEIHHLYEWGAAVYVPPTLPADILLKQLLRALRR